MHLCVVEERVSRISSASSPLTVQEVQMSTFPDEVCDWRMMQQMIRTTQTISQTLIKTEATGHRDQ